MPSAIITSLFGSHVSNPRPCPSVRWARICELSAGRRQRITDAWVTAGQLGRDLRELEPRLTTAEERLTTAAPTTDLVPRGRVRPDLETASRAAAELEQLTPTARSVSRLLRDGLRQSHLAAEGALAERAASAAGRWTALQSAAARAVQRLGGHAEVQRHTERDWTELEAGAEQLQERARLLLQEASAGDLPDGAGQLRVRPGMVMGSATVESTPGCRLIVSNVFSAGLEGW